jgi:hypothetical protein
MRWLLLILALVLVAGCWTGDSLYKHSDARSPIQPGIYRSTGPDESGRVYRISILPNGMTQFDGGEKKEIYGFAPLDRNTFVAWIDVRDNGEAPNAESGENQIYSLMVRRPDGEFRIYLPECKDEEAELARRAGATIGAGPSATCRFASRAALEKALRLLPRDDSSAMRLVRIRS